MVRSSTMPSPNPHDKVKNTWKRDWARNKTVYLVFVPVASTSSSRITCPCLAL